MMRVPTIRRVWWTATLLAPLLVLAAQDASLHWQDRAGNMTLDQFRSYAITTRDDGSMTFNGSGSPGIGAWRSQGLTIEAKNWTGRAAKEEGGAYLLKAADVQGEVVVKASSGGKPVVLRTPKATFDGTTRRIVMPGAVAIEQTTANGTITANGSSGYAEFFETKPESAPTMIRKSGLAGPVHLVMRTRRRVKDVERVQTVTADAAQLEYDAAARTITLSGGVLFTGDDEVMSADARCAKAVVTLDAGGKPIGIDMAGDPGVTHLKRRDGGIP